MDLKISFDIYNSALVTKQTNFLQIWNITEYLSLHKQLQEIISKFLPQLEWKNMK